MRRLKRLFAIAVLLPGVSALAAQAQFDGAVKIGVLTDFSSVYQDNTGNGSLAAARMAIDDYLAAHPGSALKPVVINADHQNKADIGSATARRWFDEEGVDAIVDLANSAVALGVAGLAAEKNKVTLVTSAGTTRITGDACNANTLHWGFDNYGISSATAKAVVQSGGRNWFFITADYAFGHDLEGQASRVVRASGGQVLGTARHPLGTQDFASFLLQAQGSGAQVVGFANGGADFSNALKQAVEFGIPKGQKIAGMYVEINDIRALGLDVAQGLVYSQPFYWDLNDSTRAWTQRFTKRHDKHPTANHAATYSAVLHFLKAVEAVKTRDGRQIVAQMKAMPTDDEAFGPGLVRADGRKLSPMYLFQVKAPGESKGPWDVAKVLVKVDAGEAWRPLAEGGCPLIASR